MNFKLISAVSAVLLSVSATALAQVAPPTSTWQAFGAISAAGLSGQAGSGAVIDGDVGSNTAISNFLPSIVTPGHTLYPVADPIVGTALINANTAYNFLALQATPPANVLPDDLSTIGGPLTSGVYSTTTGAALLPTLTTLTLNGPGIFVFNVDSLTMDVLSSVAGTANPCNVYWRVGSSATLNGNNFFGHVIALASVTIGDIVGPLVGTNLQGNAVGLTGAVTMAGDGGTTVGGCLAAAPGGSGSIPTLSEWAMILLAALMAGAGLVAMRKRVS